MYSAAGPPMSPWPSPPGGPTLRAVQRRVTAALEQAAGCAPLRAGRHRRWRGVTDRNRSPRAASRGHSPHGSPPRASVTKLCAAYCQIPSREPDRPAQSMNTQRAPARRVPTCQIVVARSIPRSPRMTTSHRASGGDSTPASASCGSGTSVRDRPSAAADNGGRPAISPGMFPEPAAGPRAQCPGPRRTHVPAEPQQR